MLAQANNSTELQHLAIVQTWPHVAHFASFNGAVCDNQGIRSVDCVGLNVQPDAVQMAL